PSRFDAAVAAWLIVGRRLMTNLSGLSSDEKAVKETLARKIVSTVGIAEVIPVGRSEGGVRPLASGYVPLQALADACGFVVVPPDSEGMAAGTMIEMWAFP